MLAFLFGHVRSAMRPSPVVAAGGLSAFFCLMLMTLLPLNAFLESLNDRFAPPRLHLLDSIAPSMRGHAFRSRKIPQRTPFMKRVPVITASSSLYFDRLENLIGSIHAWSPDVEIEIWNLGLTTKQVSQVQCWRKTSLLEFPFDEYPPHVRKLQNFAWKTILLDIATKKHGAIIYQDSGQELWRDIGPVLRVLEDTGSFFVHQPISLLLETHSSMFKEVGISRSDVGSTSLQCAGGIIGFTLDSSAYREILKPAVQCALVEKCIDPPGFSSGLSFAQCGALWSIFPLSMQIPGTGKLCNRTKHQYDQSLVSLLIANKTDRFTCLPDIKYSANRKLAKYPKEDWDDVILFSRRWMCPKPFARFVQMRPKDECAAIVAERSVVASEEKYSASCGYVEILPGIEISYNAFLLLVDLAVALISFFLLFAALLAVQKRSRGREKVR